MRFPYAEKRELEDREAEVARAPRTENQRRGRPAKRELQRSSVPLQSMIVRRLPKDGEIINQK